MDEKLESHEEDFEQDPLMILKVIERLEVGPVQLEKRRITAPYRVIRNGETDSMNLQYTFEEDVFEPGEPESLNLAAMISAQVALNYGLFCGEIVFLDRFDKYDRRFLEEMARNTAREIFVKKFLEPNAFLEGRAGALPPVKRGSYLQARLVFDESDALQEKNLGNRPGLKGWTTDPSRYAVLSSGGKDSLLSFGLLRETGHEVHPVFLNESGRHWFTALNAYHHFRDQIPNTARVWTNSDRLFNWMVRHLPFVRKDFSNVRSDEYPIRLWTVAVFLFGALPILRKRQVGRLVIGDEFDTTRRTSYKGIPHYDGLYDQSRYFDDALTRYFQRKNWGITQFSILRPLSEFLIQKTLVERYPELQRHQISCHAAHREAEGIRPCGRCEKCRRIVGMLMAMDADPVKCSYRADQIGSCLESLAAMGIHPEKEVVEHLGFLLVEKGLVREEKIGSIRATSRPQIMKLRFDRERSPVEGIPMDLREPLYRIILEHAEGSCTRRGRSWVDFDLWEEPDLKRPYPFKTHHGASARDSSDGRREGI